MLNELIYRLLQSYSKFLWVSDSRGESVDWFRVMRVFAGGIFKKTWLKITNYQISRACNQIILNFIGVTEF